MMPGGANLELCTRCEEAGYTIGLTVTAATYRGVHELSKLVVRSKDGTVAVQRAVNGSLDGAARYALRRLS